MMVPWRSTTATVEMETVDRLQYSGGRWYTVELLPPRHESVPTTLTPVIAALRELNSRWLGLRNTSPVIAVELRRPHSDRLRFQVAVPTKRLERKLRTHLTGHVPGIGFADGVSGLPVGEGTTVGGAFLVPGRDDWYPFNTDPDTSVMNTVAGTLHPHAMQDTQVIIQFLLRPWAGNPLRQWWYKRRAYKQIGYLKKEKEHLWGGRSATKREARQANRIEEKVSQPLWWTSIRIVVIGAGEHTQSRIRELSAGFRPVEDPVTDQYLAAESITPLRATRILGFAQAVADRRFGRWSRRFRLMDRETGALCAVPDREQGNLSWAAPR